MRDRVNHRLKNFDYSKAGVYFITICTNEKERLFGYVEDGMIHLSTGGNVAEQCWRNIPQHFPNVVLHEYIIMPNHLHGIVELKADYDQWADNFLSNQKQHEFQKMIPKSIASIVKGFKIGVTKWFRNNTDVHTVWQSNYYDEVVRDKRRLFAIAEYIRNNPKNWQEDIYFK